MPDVRGLPWELEWDEGLPGQLVSSRAIDIGPCFRCHGEFPSTQYRGEASGWKFADRRLALRGTASQLLIVFWRGCIRGAYRLPTVGWRDRTGRVDSAERFETQHSRLQAWNSCNLRRPVLLRRGLRFSPSHIRVCNLVQCR